MKKVTGAPSASAEIRVRRADRVFKPAAESGGNGVVFGDGVTDREWAALISDLDHADHVVQERQRPLFQYVIDPARQPEAVAPPVAAVLRQPGPRLAHPRGHRATGPGVIGGGNPGTERLRVHVLNSTGAGSRSRAGSSSVRGRHRQTNQPNTRTGGQPNIGRPRCTGQQHQRSASHR